MARAAATIPALDAPHRLRVTVPTAAGEVVAESTAFTVQP